MDKTLKKLNQLINKVVDKKVEINLNSSLAFDLGISSINFFELVNRIEKTFKIKIKDSEISGFNTVGDLVNYIEGNEVKKTKTQRATAIDIAKGLCIFGLPLIHVIEVTRYMNIFDYSNINFTWLLILSVVGPGIFSICMGYDIKSSTAPKRLFRTGIQMLLIGTILNFFRFAVPLLLFELLSKAPLNFLKALECILESDIYYTVGLFYLLYALFKKFKMSDFWIFIVSIVFLIGNSIIYYFDSFNSDTVLAMIFGNFIYVDEYSSFPIMSWFIFPLIGMLLAKKPFKDWQVKELVLGSEISLFVVVIIFIISKALNLDFYHILATQQFDYRCDILSVGLQIALSLVVLFIAQIFIKLVKRNPVEDFIERMSNYLMPFYLIHWIIVGFVTFGLGCFFYKTASLSPFWLFVIAIVITLASLFLSVQFGNRLMGFLLKITSFVFLKKKVKNKSIIKVDEMTFGSLLKESALLDADQLIYKDEDNEISRIELLDSSKQISNYFFSRKLIKSNIGVFCEKSVNWVRAYFGITYGNNTAVLFNPDLPEKILLEQINLTEVKLIICSINQKDKIEKLLLEGKTKLDVLSFEELFSDSDKCERQFENIEGKEDDVATIIFSSGTTGKSKAVMLTNKNLVFDALKCVEITIAGHMNSPYNTTVVLPVFHAYALTTGVFVPLISGGTAYFNKSNKNLIEDIIKTKPNYLSLVPQMVTLIENRFSLTTKKVNLRKELGGNLQYIFCGGATFPKALLNVFKRTKVNVYNGYGISECSPLVSMNVGVLSVDGSLGFPLDGVKVELSDKNEILVKGDNVMKGYYNNHEATKEAFTDDGYFRTGDLGSIGEKGEIYFEGRLKNLIILSNGENIAPETIEDEFANLNEVIGVKAIEENDQICLEVYPNYKINNVKEKINIIVKEVNKKLPSIMKIAQVKYRDEDFKRTAIGKIIR